MTASVVPKVTLYYSQEPEISGIALGDVHVLLSSIGGAAALPEADAVPQQPEVKPAAKLSLH